MHCLCGSPSWDLKDMNSEWVFCPNIVITLQHNDCNPLVHSRGLNRSKHNNRWFYCFNVEYVHSKTFWNTFFIHFTLLLTLYESISSIIRNVLDLKLYLKYRNIKYYVSNVSEMYFKATIIVNFIIRHDYMITRIVKSDKWAEMWSVYGIRFRSYVQMLINWQPHAKLCRAHKK